MIKQYSYHATNFVFGEAPPIGMMVGPENYMAELLSIEPYVRKRDGAASFLLTWNCRCQRRSCGDRFENTSGMTGAIRAKCFGCLPKAHRDGREA